MAASWDGNDGAAGRCGRTAGPAPSIARQRPALVQDFNAYCPLFHLPRHLMRQKKTMRSEMGWSTPDRIVVRGLDLVNEIMGKVSLGDMAWLEITGALPTPPQSVLFNALLVTLAEHGMT